ncbi:alkene reductase [uncultured Tateyamaria sp.]|uniref:alkene reductase n=1 Tax=uncultured Tateyamaria sp. TaxID=455651 RepID=UPI00261E1FF4|nr:alkene reductase [uncultured Tateyamaria sp.]
MTQDLFSKTSLGSLQLPNRMVMAPMSRSRAIDGGVPSQMMVEHYADRATAGLIISESAPVSQQGVGYPNTPGIFIPQQTSGWLRIMNSVRSKGGRMFAQLQHCGRISHPSHQEDNALPVAPSAMKPDGFAFTASGYQKFETPRSLETSEIPDVVDQFRLAAQNAKDAGLDGVEVHGANGYLIDQFLRDGTNKRTDGYGGSIENRTRFLQEVIEAVTTVFPADRVGVKLSPENTFNGMSDSEPQQHFEKIVAAIADHGLGYLHVTEASMGITGHIEGSAKDVDYRRLRSHFPGTYIANNGYSKADAIAAIQSGHADLVAFGAPFLANPDLVRRYREDLPLNAIDKATFYVGGKTGYNDYPFADRDLMSAA